MVGVYVVFSPTSLRERAGVPASRVASALRGTTVLFIGAGRHQRRAIARVRELGVRVVAVDGNADAPGLGLADAG
jgi:formate-dependent phosphoribosylglycinamide formyltransferase (GAR transformylase)